MNQQVEDICMNAMKMFLSDYQLGLEEGRYCYHELPNSLPVVDNFYDIGLSSHFLLLYTQQGFEFHMQTIGELLRVCKEVRIFPIVDLDAKESFLLLDILNALKKKYKVEVKETNYQFQKNANKMLILQK